MLSISNSLNSCDRSTDFVSIHNVMGNPSRSNATRIIRELSDDFSPEPSPKQSRFIDDEASKARTPTERALSIQAVFDGASLDSAISLFWGVAEFESLLMALVDGAQKMSELQPSF